jgi:hypothetical protein
MRHHRSDTTGGEIAGTIFLGIIVVMLAMAILLGLGMFLIYVLTAISRATGVAV